MVNKSPEELIAMGYRRVSRRHRIVARIDRPDWKQAMADMYRRGDMAWVEGLGEGGAEDFYRRSSHICKDWVEVDAATIRKIPTSNHAVTGYIEI